MPLSKNATVTGPILNGNVQPLPTTRVSLQSKTAARCHCHRLLSCIASRYHLLCDSILRISHDTHLSSSLAREYFDPSLPRATVPTSKPYRTHTRFLQRRQSNPTSLPDPKQKAVPVVTTNSRAIIHRDRPTEKRSYIGINKLVDQTPARVAASTNRQRPRWHQQ